MFLLLDVNLIKHVLDFYAENYKLLVKETKALNKESYSLHSKDMNFLKIDIGFQCNFYQNLQLFSHSVVSVSLRLHGLQ